MLWRKLLLELTARMGRELLELPARMLRQLDSHKLWLELADRMLSLELRMELIELTARMLSQELNQLTNQLDSPILNLGLS